MTTNAITHKTCSRCKVKKPVTSFHKRTKSKSGLCSKCKDCQNALVRNHYRRTYGEENRKRMKKNRDIRRDLLRKFYGQFLLDNPCVDCGETDIRVLEADHLKDKKIEISMLMRYAYSIERVKEELAKCQVRCANCHRRITTTRRKDWRHNFFHKQKRKVRA